MSVLAVWRLTCCLCGSKRSKPGYFARFRNVHKPASLDALAELAAQWGNPFEARGIQGQGLRFRVEYCGDMMWYETYCTIKLYPIVIKYMIYDICDMCILEVVLCHQSISLPLFLSMYLSLSLSFYLSPCLSLSLPFFFPLSLSLSLALCLCYTPMSLGWVWRCPNTALRHSYQLPCFNSPLSIPIFLGPRDNQLNTP